MSTTRIPNVDESGNFVSTNVLQRLDERFGTATAIDRRRSPLTIGFGDSITESSADPMGKGQGERSYFAQACVVSDQRITFHRNVGVSGNTVEQMWARIETDVIAHSPSRVMFMGGTNNMNQTDQSSAQAHVRMILDRLHEAGIWVAVVSIPPSEGMTTTGRARMVAHNEFLRQAAEERGFPFVDIYQHLVNPDTGGWLPGLSTDGVHPNEVGAQLMGRLVFEALAPHYPARSVRTATAFNTTQNVLANPALADAGGDGVPDSWVLGGAANGTTTITQEPGVNGNVFTLNRTNTATAAFSLSQNITSLIAGDRFEFAVRFKTTGGVQVNLYAAASDAAYAQLAMFKPVNAWVGEYGWVTALMRGAYPANATRLQVYLNTGAGTGSLSVAQPMVRKIM